VSVAVAPTEALSSIAIAPVLVCLLGSFRVVKAGSPITLRAGGKAEQFIGAIALRPRDGVGREELLGLVWPSSDPSLASQSLNTLVYSVNRSLGDALNGRPPVVRRDGRYHLNADAGVAVDVRAFDTAVETGDRLAREGDRHGAIQSYDGAAALYEGDLVIGSDVRQLLERERLRARYLWILARLADHHFAAGEYGGALTNALDLLAHDPCREDAHRMAMRCYVRRGERAQAMRQYAVCREVLALEFEVTPEPGTEALFELIRFDPAKV
jgi:DNA-binding SARP family transcriptional activator